MDEDNPGSIHCQCGLLSLLVSWFATTTLACKPESQLGCPNECGHRTQGTFWTGEHFQATTTDSSILPSLIFPPHFLNDKRETQSLVCLCKFMCFAFSAAQLPLLLPLCDGERYLLFICPYWHIPIYHFHLLSTQKSIQAVQTISIPSPMMLVDPNCGNPGESNQS